MKFACALFAYLIVVPGACGRSSAVKRIEPLPELINAVRPAVVQVAVQISGGPPPPQFKSCFDRGPVCIVGTGFFVNPSGDVITAFHVVEGFDTIVDGKPVSHPGLKEVIESTQKMGTSAEIVIGVALPNVDTQHLMVAAGTMLFDAKVGVTDPAHDLALLQMVANNPFKGMQPLISNGAKIERPSVKAVELATERPNDGDDVFTCGYPWGLAGLISTSGTVASAWNSKQLIRAAAAGFTNSVSVYDLDVKINPGNSGGPVFRSSDQAVLGVVVEVQGTIGVAVPAVEVAKFLDANKVPWQAPTKKH